MIINKLLKEFLIFKKMFIFKELFIFKTFNCDQTRHFVILQPLETYMGNKKKL